MDFLLVSGWTLVGAGIYLAIRARVEDQRLSALLPPALERRWRRELLEGAPHANLFDLERSIDARLFLILPLRWDRARYDQRGAAVVDRLWLFAAGACVFIPMGLMMVEAAVAGS